jgi:phosphoribosyl-ATP pyrophosphohydrolase/phosphoribosyl-AMP cyclohydrolase
MKFDDRGLAPAVAQDAVTGAVLMVAWINAEALEKTLASGEAHFFSRSRNELWRKGATSGHVLRVIEVRLDCDDDAVLLLVEPSGPACHTGKASCFHRVMPTLTVDEGPPGDVLERLWRVIQLRRLSTGERSYTRSLLDAGMLRILAKITEEHGELCAELPSGPEERVVHEMADLLYHLWVGLAARGIPPARVMAELERRFGTSGHEEKASRTT